jgi:hypothetical protein
MAIKKVIDIDVNSKSLGQLEEQLEDVNQELKNLDRNSDAFKEAAAKSQILTKEIEKINNEIEGIGLEDKLMAADGAAKIFGGSLSTVVGTLGTLGIESEAFGEFEEKAASAIAVGLGIKDVSEGFGQFTQVMKKSGVAAKLFGSTTSKALIATGVGAFVVLLGSVIAYWDNIKKAVENTAKAFPFIGKAIEGVKGAFNALFDAARPVLEFLGILPDEAERAAIATKKATENSIKEIQREIAIAEASGASAKKIFDLKKKLLEEELRLLQQANDDKEAIFAKETELLALEAAEQRRIRESKVDDVKREKVETVNTITSSGLAEIETTKATTDQVSVFNKDAANQNAEFMQQQMENQAKLDAARRSSLDNVIALAGAESKVGKAAFLAKQALMLQELVMEAKRTISFATQASARATVSTAEGAAQTAKVGFPQNIPLLIAYAAQAAGIIMSVKSAVQTAGSSTGGVGGGVSATPRATAAPAFNVVGAAPENQLAQTIGNQEQKPLKAFVVSSEVSSQQALDRNIENGAAIG